MPLRRTVLALALALCSGAAQAQSPRWPERAYGQAIPLDGVRPTGDVGVLRSWHAPVDVHVGPGVDAATALAVLADAEAAMDGLERIGVALPLPDGNRGGSPSFDLYLRTRAVCDPEEVCSGLATEGDALSHVDTLSYVGPWDRATAFARVPVIVDATAQRRAVAQVIAEACIYGAKADHHARVGSRWNSRTSSGSCAIPVARRARLAPIARTNPTGWSAFAPYTHASAMACATARRRRTGSAITSTYPNAVARSHGPA